MTYEKDSISGKAIVEKVRMASEMENVNGGIFKKIIGYYVVRGKC